MRRPSIVFAILSILTTVACSRFRANKDKDEGSADAKEAIDEEAPPSACEGDNCLPDTKSTDRDGNRRDPLSFTGDLRRLETCQQIEDAIEQKIIDQLETEASDLKERFRAYKTNHQTYYYSGRFEGDVAVSADSAAPMASAEGAASDASSSSSPVSSGPSNVSTTNNQVAGVEEADIVKTDGKFIYVVSHNRLYIVKSWPAEDTAVVGSLPFFDEYVRDMTFDEQGQLIVIGDAFSAPLSGYWNQLERTSITVVDVSEPTAPRATRHLTLPGSYNTSRRIGSSLRLVLHNGHNFYRAHISWQVENLMYMMDLTEEEFVARVDLELQRNVAATQSKSLDFWLLADAYAAESSGERARLDRNNQCQQVYLPTAPTELGLTTVATVDLEGGGVTTAQILTDVGLVYANETSLYLTTPYWWWRPAGDQSDYTYLHKFDITDSAQATYIGSGRVEGVINNQFSLDEYDGRLRVAATTQRRVATPGFEDGPLWWRPFDVEIGNYVTVLGDAESRLVELGQTPKFGDGETIYSVRFNGPKGYVVTFRQIDPLFTLDLSNPRDPRVTGELTIDGVSTYIHILDQDHLLTVGRGSGWNTLRISIFNVQDVAQPVAVDTLDLPMQWSNAQYDHKAFTYLPEKGLLSLPVVGYGGADQQTYWWNDYRSTAMVFSISTTEGIKSLGELRMNDIYRGTNYGWYWWYGFAEVTRTVLADDYIYAISNFGVRSANINDLEHPLATAEFMSAD